MAGIYNSYSSGIFSGGVQRTGITTLLCALYFLQYSLFCGLTLWWTTFFPLHFLQFTVSM
jgi:hypothetical protein